jgi:hypothetical protein
LKRGRRLTRRRGELIERSFAHLYDTGGMRRTHLRGHTNILKRLLIHAGGFNLGLLLRAILSVGTPRGLHGRGGRAVAALLYLMHIVHGTAYGQSRRLVLNSVVASFELLVFALILCRHRNRDLRHGLLGLVRSTDRSQA